MLFNANREAVRLIVECGIGTSCMERITSLGQACVCGAITSPKPTSSALISIGSVLFSEDRISTYYCDQTDARSIEDFRKAAHLSASSVDIIVDDGLHTFDAGKCFFENAIDLLKRDGTYVIEDVVLPRSKGIRRILRSATR